MLNKREERMSQSKTTSSQDLSDSLIKIEKKRLYDLVDNVPGVVWEAYGKPDKKSQKIDFVNSFVEKMLGYTVEEWVKTPNFWLTIVHPEDKERAASEAAEIYSSGKGGISRFRWITKDGKIIWVEVQSFVVKDGFGKTIGMRGVSMDMTERMELERRKDEFISVASHELKTPIASIKGYTQILAQSLKDNQKATHYLAKMDNQIDRLSKLMNNLLDVSKIQSGKLELEKQEVIIDNLVKEVIEDMSYLAPNHKIKILGEKNLKVLADKYRLSEVIINLISNAIKYSPAANRVILKIASTSSEVIISIQDFGIGISKKNLNRVFERFFQADTRIRQSFSGLGLGLYISSEIIKKHGGKIWVESEKGEGSTFYFSLPLKIQEKKVIKKGELSGKSISL